MKSRSRRIECVTVALVSNPVRSGLMILAGVATVIGCGYSLVSDNSVRFNYRTGRAFYRLPPLPLRYDKNTGKEIAAKQIEDWSYEEDVDEASERNRRSIEEADLTWIHAQTAIDRSEFSEARISLEKFLELTELPVEWFEDEDKRQQQRNSAVDLLDAMSALRQGSKHDAVKAYLDARRTYDEATSPVNIGELRSRASSDVNLRDNWHYLEGAAAYKSGDKEAAGERFHSLPAWYPRSEKKEAALYMAAKVAMESSYSFGNPDCGFYTDNFDAEAEQPEGAIQNTGATTDRSIGNIEPDEKCRDGKWHTALQAFNLLMASHPDGRYVDDARGWVAYLHRRGGQRAEALAEYYRMLGHPTSWRIRLEAKKSLQMLGHPYDDQTLDRVEDLLAGDVNGAMAYAYHRIYNHAVDYSYEASDPWFHLGADYFARAEEAERVERVRKKGKHELERVARFATSMMKRHPQAHVSAGFVLRVAEAELELRNFDSASALARKALALGVEGDLRAQGLWVKGCSEHQRKQFSAAEATFDRLIAEFPKSKYVEGSRRMLAMVAEDRGDLESALKIYLALDYEYDVAYFLDVLIPTDRLAKFIESHKNIPEYNRLLYGLGVRYMREKRWDEARAALRRVQTERGTDGFLRYDEKDSWYFAKEPGFDHGEISYVKTSWVMQDLKTIDVFESHERAVESAEGDEAKAEAMYQLGSAFFEADDLAFYNPSAWNGARVGSLELLQFSDHERHPNESQIIYEHLQVHDPWAQAIPIYEEIVARFPQTKVARDAMYSAAVAHERLSGRNRVWGAVYARGLFAGPRLLTYADVRGMYPNYQLPRGTYGWKPSTRTVNGGPGWAAPEKPKPRETREQKIKRLLREFKAELSEASTKLSSSIKPRVEGGISWYGSMIEAAVYGILSGIGLWALMLIGINLHLRRIVPQTIGLSEDEPPPGANSRVDKIIG